MKLLAFKLPEIKQLAEIYKRSYGMALTFDDEVAGLTAGDQGYEWTKIKIQELFMAFEILKKETEEDWEMEHETLEFLKKFIKYINSKLE